jgi:hypothetical protein
MPRSDRRGGVVLLEVLAAAAIAAFALLAIIGVLERCETRESASARLWAAARTAEALLAEAEAQPELAPGLDEGQCDDLPGGRYRREVELWAEEPGLRLLRIKAAVSGPDGAEAFVLEKWVYRSDAGIQER